MKRVVKRLRHAGGFTLTEVLVTLAIFSVLTLAIMAGTGSAAKIYRNAVMASEAETLSSTLVQSLSDELRYARNIQVDPADPDGTVSSFDSATFGPGTSIQTTESGSIRMGQQELLGASAYTGGLRADVELHYISGVFQMKVTVSSAGNTPIRTVETAVRALNP